LPAGCRIAVVLKIGAILVLLALVACGGASPPASTPPTAATATGCDVAVDASSAEAYTASALRLLGCALPGAKMSIVEPLMVRVSKAGQDRDVSVERPWSSCRSSRRGCDDALREYVGSVVEAVNHPPEVSPETLRAVIRNRAELEAACAYAPDVEIVSEPLAADLVVILAFDSPRALGYVTEAHLSTLGMTRAAAAARARANLRDELGPLEAAVSELPPDGVSLIYTQSAYEPSRLLQHEEWGAVARHLGGGLLVCVPAGDLILFADDRVPGARQRLASAAREIVARAERPVSSAILRWTETGWTAEP